MLKNYLTTAWRNLIRHKLFSVINVIGLSVGICASIVIALVVVYEFSYEQYHPEKDQIFRIVTLNVFAEEEFPNGGVPAPMANAIRDELSDVAEVAAFHIWHPDVTIAGKEGDKVKSFPYQDNVILADHHYFNLFPYQWLIGSPSTSLDEPMEVVLTESRAKAYFSLDQAEEAMGREITYDDSTRAIVSGVVKGLNEVTEFTFQEFLSLSSANELKTDFYLDHWDNVNSDSQLFVKLNKGIPAETVEAQLPETIRKYVDDYNMQHFLQPLTDIHFNAKYDNFEHAVAHAPTLYGLLVLALFILLLGCINFINLTTAAGSERAKEIAVRKTLGSKRSQIILQFLSETMLLGLISGMLSLVLVPLILQWFSEFIPQGLTRFHWIRFHYLLFVLLFVMLVGALSGMYPALIMSRFNPVRLIKSSGFTMQGKSGKTWLRQTLIVFQFTIAISLVVSTLIVNEQISFALNKDMGFRKEAIITFSSPFDRNHDQSRFVLLNMLQSIPGLKTVSIGGQPPASEGTISYILEYTKENEKITTNVDFKYGDTAYLDTYELTLLAGRNLQNSDTIKEFLINETFLHQLGFSEPADALGLILDYNGKEVPIVGVVADFHMKSLRVPIKPTAITTDQRQHRTFHIALAGTDTKAWQSGLSKIQQSWKEVYPDETFDYQFVETRVEAFYESEQRMAKLLKWSTGIAILISCLGLFGLATYTAVQRTKEIGIRKVLGASLVSLLLLLSRDYVKLIILSLCIAIPLANYFMHEWLSNFTWSISIHWWMFVLPGILVLLVAVLSVISQTLKTARKNPVDSLRYE